MLWHVYELKYYTVLMFQGFSMFVRVPMPLVFKLMRHFLLLLGVMLSLQIPMNIVFE